MSGGEVCSEISENARRAREAILAQVPYFYWHSRIQYPSAQPSLRGSEPPVSVPFSQSIQIA